MLSQKILHLADDFIKVPDPFHLLIQELLIGHDLGCSYSAKALDLGGMLTKALESSPGTKQLFRREIHDELLSINGKLSVDTTDRTGNGGGAIDH